MAEFGIVSRERLDACVWPLQQLMERVVQIRDISVICGSRPQEDQDRAVAEGSSEIAWPDSLHNITDERPAAEAVDIVPWPEQYSDPLLMIHVAGVVLGVAAEMKIPLRWGGDWDSDGDLTDQKFKDLWHFEIVK